MEQNATVWIVIALAFLLNLIVTLVFRFEGKRDRSLKKIKDEIRNFRTETKTTEGRIRELSSDSEATIRRKCEEADKVILRIKESLEVIFMHEKELNAMEDVLENYHRALVQLKGETEFANAKTEDVKGEMLKVEKAKEEIKAFEEESQGIINRMQDQRSEMARFVSSSEKALKDAARRQEDENKRMLESFEASLAAFKVEFDEHAEEEKASLKRTSNDFEEKAKGYLDSTLERIDRIEENLSRSESGLNLFRSESAKTIEELRESLEGISGEVTLKVTSSLEEIQGELEKANSSLDLHMKEKGDELERVAEEFAARLNSKLEESERHLAEIEAKARDRAKELDAEAERIVVKARRAFAEELEATAEKSAKEMKRVRENIEEMNASLQEAASECKEAFADIQKGTGDKIEAALSSLSEIKDRTEKANSDLQKLSEQLTAKREELWQEDKKKSDLIGEIKRLKGERADEDELLKNAHAKRIEEEAKIVELKLKTEAHEEKDKIEILDESDFVLPLEEVDLRDE